MISANSQWANSMETCSRINQSDETRKEKDCYQRAVWVWAHAVDTSDDTNHFAVASDSHAFEYVPEETT